LDFGLTQLVRRLQGYLQTEPYQVVMELLLIWAVVYLIVRFLRGTRGAGVVKGVALLLLVGTLVLAVLGRGSGFDRLNYLYSNFIAFFSLILIVVFQPELRRALTRIGEASFFRGGGLRKARVIEELIESIDYLARNKIGALIAIERQVGLRGIVDVGTHLDAEVSAELLNTIFWPGSALHDMGVIIRGDRIVSGGSQFPLADGEGLPQELGSRHRAAIGLSQESDALILIVSEETGTISVAERGTLTRRISTDDLRTILTKGLVSVGMTNAEAGNNAADAAVDDASARPRAEVKDADAEPADTPPPAAEERAA